MHIKSKLKKRKEKSTVAHSLRAQFIVMEKSWCQGLEVITCNASLVKKQGTDRKWDRDLEPEDLTSVTHVTQ